MLGFPQFFVSLSRKKWVSDEKSSSQNINFFAAFLSHSAKNSVVGPYESVEKQILDKFIQQKRGYLDFLITFLTEVFEYWKIEPSFAFDK